MKKFPLLLLVLISLGLNYKYVDYIADSKYQQGVDWSCSISSVNVPIAIRGNLNNNVNITFGALLSFGTQINRAGTQKINGFITDKEITVNEDLSPKIGLLAAIGYQFGRKRISPYVNLEGRIVPGNFGSEYTPVMNNYLRISIGINLASKESVK